MKLKVIRQIIVMAKYCTLGIFLQTLLGSLLFAENSIAQKSVYDIEVNFNKQNASLSQIIQKIEHDTELYFSFEGTIEIQKEKFDLPNRTTSVGDVLALVSENSNLGFKRINDNIIIKKKKLDAKYIVEVLTDSAENQLGINGMVKEAATGDPLPGVSILIKETSKGTTTDINGNYSIMANQGDVLQFSFIGFQTYEVEIGSQTTIDVSLQNDLEQLEEVVVVGYGVQKKSDITGSVASVKSEDLVAFPALDVAQTLQGRAAGVQISSVNGQPGTASRIRVRGGTSVNASSDPLIVVDGLIGAQLPPPEDIASIEILKDASSTAIYGSRGANGVIVVSTRSGSSGKARVNFSTSYTSQEVINTLDLLNRDQVIDYMTEAVGSFTPYSDANGGNFDTDWQDEIFRTGGVQNYNLSVAGGNDNVKYYVSGALFDQKGIILNSGFERYSLTSNIDAKISEKVSIGANLLVFSQ